MVNKKIPLLDLQIQYDDAGEDIRAAIDEVFSSQQFILGEKVVRFEQAVADYCGCMHGIGLASGTDALTLSFRALGIGPGDEVIVPTFTFFATAECVLHVGATPVFVDVRSDTYCIDVALIEPLITENTRAIVPVHLFGHPADMGGINELASRYGLKVVEDNAQAFGARYSGQVTGAIGDVGCLSFFPSKNLGGCGDGGMVVTSDDVVADNLRMLRMHGWKKKNFPEIVGYNSRLDTLQAAILDAKLPKVDAWNEQRRRSAERYNAAMKDMDLVLPVESDGVKHVYNLYVVRVKNRESVQETLRRKGVGSAVYYPAAIHELTPCIEYIRKGQHFPVAERAAKEVLAIPMYPGITEDQQDYVVEALSEALG